MEYTRLPTTGDTDSPTNSPYPPLPRSSSPPLHLQPTHPLVKHKRFLIPLAGTLALLSGLFLVPHEGAWTAAASLLAKDQVVREDYVGVEQLPAVVQPVESVLQNFTWTAEPHTTLTRQLELLSPVGSTSFRLVPPLQSADQFLLAVGTTSTRVALFDTAAVLAGYRHRHRRNLSSSTDSTWKTVSWSPASTRGVRRAGILRGWVL